LDLLMIIKSKQEQDARAGEDQRAERSRAAARRVAESRPRQRFWLKPLLILIAVLGGGGVLYAGYGLWQHSRQVSSQTFVYHTVKRGDLAITVTERGNLESQKDLDILCEVDDVSGDGINGTPIVWIIDNGASVSEGDLLVELDAAPHIERLDRQALDTEKAIAAQIQAEAKHRNQQSQNETTEADSELDQKLAELELEMFKDEENGTHRLEVEAIERQIEDINNEILAAQGSMELKRSEKLGLETLFKLGYAGERQVEQSRLDFLQAESQYASKMNKLKTQLASLRKKQTYERKMELLRLEGAVETAKRRVGQVLVNNEAQLAQTQSALDAANESLKKEKELLERYKEQVEKCKIYAPQDGMVAYATSRSRYSNEEIRQGAAVRERQKILSLPNLTRMQVKTSIHESVLNQVKPGLKATVRVDAFPDRVYPGTVVAVAVLPDQGGWFSPDTKVYETQVLIDEEVERLKPGMTAVVEIDVDRLQDVLTVPVQAIVQRKKETSCFVEAGAVPERRVVKLGRTNDKFVEVVEGLNPGDRVVLNPMAILDETEAKEDDADEDSGPASELPESNAPAERPRPESKPVSDAADAGPQRKQPKS
jgi:RND family efflux transporter MFP subunit